MWSDVHSQSNGALLYTLHLINSFILIYFIVIGTISVFGLLVGQKTSLEQLLSFLWYDLPSFLSFLPTSGSLLCWWGPSPTPGVLACSSPPHLPLRCSLAPSPSEAPSPHRTGRAAHGPQFPFSQSHETTGSTASLGKRRKKRSQTVNYVKTSRLVMQLTTYLPTVPRESNSLGDEQLRFLICEKCHLCERCPCTATTKLQIRAEI